ncbi:MAG: cupin domain-containing protein [Candidatus Paceibacterota bacterium]
MKIDIITQAQANTDYRKVIATGADSQLVLMNLQPGDDVGEEVYGDVDQITVVVDGSGLLEMPGDNGPIEVGDLIFAPAGVKHNIINDSEGELKLYTIYAPPEYEPGSVQEEDEQESEYIDEDLDNFEE